MRYTLMLDGGVVIEDSGSQPFQYLHGASNIVPGLERRLEGCRAGDRLVVTVPPESGYGVLQPELVRRLARAELPSDAPLCPGDSFMTEIGDGTALRAWVLEAGDDDILVSFCHPLAGENLHFVVEVLAVRAAHHDELLQGRPA